MEGEKENEDITEVHYCDNVRGQLTKADDGLKQDERKHVPAAPDGGWGWVVCAACFMSHVLTDGIFYSFGVVFVELLDYYNSSKGETAVIASLATGVCFFGGPVIAMVTNRYGCRVAAVIGTLIASAGLIISIFAPNILFLYFSLGVLFGIGYGMIYLPSIVSVSQYFEKHRAFATGIGVSGAGIGTFVLSPLTSLMIRRYTWQGAILIHAGLVLNCLACAFVYRPIIKNVSIYKSHGGNYEDRQEVTDLDSDALNSTENGISRNGAHLDIDAARTDSKYISKSKDSEDCNKLASEQPLLNETTTKCSEIENPESEKRGGIFKEIVASVRTNFDVSIFQNVAYNMFLASTFLYSLGYYVPYIYLPDTAREAGIDDLKGSFLVSSIGITNTIGRVLFGFLSDRKGVNRLTLYATALAICGAATCVGPLLSSFEMLLVYTIVFGSFSGVTISLTSVLLSDIVGVHRLADGLGVSNFFAGIGSFAGPPIAGWLYDISGDYLMSYIAAGATIFLSGVMLYPLPCIENRFRQKSQFTTY